MDSRFVSRPMFLGSYWWIFTEGPIRRVSIGTAGACFVPVWRKLHPDEPQTRTDIVVSVFTF